MGYEAINQWRIYSPETRTVYVRRDVIFNEKELFYAATRKDTGIYPADVNIQDTEYGIYIHKPAEEFTSIIPTPEQLSDFKQEDELITSIPTHTV